MLFSYGAIFIFASALCLPLHAQQPATREMNDLNWMEFQEWVPKKTTTVLLPTGTLEPHGVANNGADNTAPVAIARQMAPKVNALIAPVVPYGVTGSLDAYPGAFSISESAYRAYLADVLSGLAKQDLRNIIVWGVCSHCGAGPCPAQSTRRGMNLLLHKPALRAVGRAWPCPTGRNRPKEPQK